MGKSKRNRNSRKGQGKPRQQPPAVIPTTQELAKDGLERRKFTFNNYFQLTLRNSWFTTYTNQQCYAAFYADVNGLGWNLYDGLGNPISGTAFNVNFGSVWGSAAASGPIGSTDQFPEWANIYSLYTVEEVGMRLTPFSFAATGSQGPITVLTGGQGIIAALIESGQALNPAVFSGALGDTKNLRMVMPFKQAHSTVTYKHLIPSEVNTTFKQTISEGLSSGFRQLFPSRTRYGRLAGDPDVLQAQLPAMVMFMPFTFTEELSVGKALAVFQPWCRMSFQQRRTSIASLSSKAYRAFISTEIEKRLRAMAAWDEMISRLQPIQAPQIMTAPQESKVITRTMPTDSDLLTMLQQRGFGRDQSDLCIKGIEPNPGPHAAATSQDDGNENQDLDAP